ncbi:hypothetical protein D3C76_1314570 [compost metagenome]
MLRALRLMRSLKMWKVQPCVLLACCMAMCACHISGSAPVWARAWAMPRLEPINKLSPSTQ